MLQTLTVEFEMPLWRVIPFADDALLALELRDQVARETRFAVVDVRTGQLILPPVTATDDWWAGLQAASLGKLFLHTFHRQPQIGISGLEVIESASGKKAWELPGHALRGIQNNMLLVQKADNPGAEEFLVDAFSGNKIATPAKEQQRENSETDSSEFPVVYLPDNLYYSTLQEFLQLKLGLEAKGPLEYLETGKQIIFSFHLEEKEKLGNYLVVFSNSGHLKFRKKLTADLSGFASDTFFIFHNKLITVQQYKTLLIVDLQH